MKIYTKTGDTGDTSLLAGGRVRKYDLRVEAYGTVDELNSHLGFVRSLPDAPPRLFEWLTTIQNDLFTIGADLATPLNSPAEWLKRLNDTSVEQIEAWIDELDAVLPALKNFILPGGTPVAAAVHVARTVCRRAERVAVALSDEQPVNAAVLRYLNRLSDFLFTLARWVNMQAGISETNWSARKQS